MITRGASLVGVGALAGILGVQLCLSGLSHAEDTPTRGPAARTTTKKTDSTDLMRLERKVEKVLANQGTILANQQTILTKFDEVMEELRIIKVRATLK